MGWVTPLGCSLDGVWQAMLNGESAIRPTTLFDASSFPTTFSAQVQDFDLKTFLGADYDRHANASRNTRFALAAAQMAWQHAGLDKFAGLDKTRTGVYLGCGEGPFDFDHFTTVALGSWDVAKNDLDMAKWTQIAYQQFEPTRELEQEPNMASGHIAALFGLEGPCFNTLTACAASTQAIGEATCQIRRGDADMMVSGGAHTMIHPLGVTGFNRLTALSMRNDDYKTASRPFDRSRDGFVMGEGAGLVILEELEHAKKRGAKILAEIVGFGSTADAFRITDIHEDGRGGTAAMRAALTDAGLKPQDIHYINAHGTGTQENDKIESLAIRHVLGDYAMKVPVSSTKSMMGHLIAAAGAVELITCVLTIRDKIIPPTINYSQPDPNCDLDYVPNEARKAAVSVAVSNSFGFGGQNDSIIVREFAA
jgi:3-oxoacyl-[acyl-carrier-protein] synthase II